jgi:hypothetical protein
LKEKVDAFRLLFSIDLGREFHAFDPFTRMEFAMVVVTNLGRIILVAVLI